MTLQTSQCQVRIINLFLQWVNQNQIQNKRKACVEQCLLNQEKIFLEPSNCVKFTSLEIGIIIYCRWNSNSGQLFEGQFVSIYHN